MRSAFFKHSLVAVIFLLSSSHYVLGQRELLLPIQIKENRIDSCAIIKEEQKNDSLYESVLATFSFNDAGQIVNGYHYKHTNRLFQIETYLYDDRGNIIEDTKRDLPNTTIESHDSSSEFAKRWVEELHFHNRHVKHRYTYNSANHLIKEEVFDADFDTAELSEEDKIYICYFSYNTSGCLASKIEVSPEEDTTGGMQGNRTIYTCNEKGEIIKETFKQNGEEIRSRYYFYNDQGKKTKEENHYRANTNPSVISYEYDSLMNQTSVKKYNKENVLQKHYSYTYDDSLLLEYKFREDDGEYFLDVYYEYDSLKRKKNITSITLEGIGYSASKGYFYKKKKSYNESGKIKSEEKYSKRFLFNRYEGKVEYFYNNLGQLTNEKEYDRNKQLWKNTFYDYNQKDKTVKATEFDKDSVLVDYELRYQDSTGIVYARKLFDPTGKIILYQTYKYDEAGEETGGVFFKKGRREVIKQYTYNKNGTYNNIRIIEKNWGEIEGEYTYRYTYY